MKDILTWKLGFQIGCATCASGPSTPSTARGCLLGRAFDPGGFGGAEAEAAGSVTQLPEIPGISQ